MSTVIQPQVGVLTPEIHSAYAIGVQQTLAGDGAAAPGDFLPAEGDLVTNPVTVGAAAFSFARGFVTDTDGVLGFTDASGIAITSFPVVAGVVYPIGISVLSTHSVDGSNVFLLF